MPQEKKKRLKKKVRRLRRAIRKDIKGTEGEQLLPRVKRKIRAGKGTAARQDATALRRKKRK
jgi:hypothetical protein